MKKIGKMIKMSYKQIQLWDNNKLDIVTQGVIAKFEQNEKLKEWLFIIKDHIIAVNPFDNAKKSSMNMQGLKEVLGHIKEHPIGIFPAGEVSALQLNTKIK